jgi:hypothetical protein
MIERVLAAKIAQYAPRDALEQECVLAELLQHYVLVGLAKSGLFREAEFHGGTFLRMLHGLDRFSEDLDFVLQRRRSDFSWADYVGPLAQYLEAEGFHVEVIDRTNTNDAVKKAFLKTDSVGKLLVLDLPYSRDPRRKIRIKLEIDTNPPEGSVTETRYVNFPVLTAVTTQTLESAFASKSHALLCRSYTKGRDWYDFLWYVARRVRPNLVLLQNAVQQAGPWARTSLDVTPAWYIDQLRATVARIDWRATTDDVRRFVPPEARASLSLWSVDMFDDQVRQLATNLQLRQP